VREIVHKFRSSKKRLLRRLPHFFRKLPKKQTLIFNACKFHNKLLKTQKTKSINTAANPIRPACRLFFRPFRPIDSDGLVMQKLANHLSRLKIQQIEGNPVV